MGKEGSRHGYGCPKIKYEIVDTPVNLGYHWHVFFE